MKIMLFNFFVNKNHRYVKFNDKYLFLKSNRMGKVLNFSL